MAEVDGSIHVFSDAAMSEEEDDGGPRRVQEKHVLLDHVPQVPSSFLNVPLMLTPGHCAFFVLVCSDFFELVNCAEGNCYCSEYQQLCLFFFLSLQT